MVGQSAAWDYFPINYLFIMKKVQSNTFNSDEHLEIQGSNGHFSPIANSLQRTSTSMN